MDTEAQIGSPFQRLKVQQYLYGLAETQTPYGRDGSRLYRLGDSYWQIALLSSHRDGLPLSTFWHRVLASNQRFSAYDHTFNDPLLIRPPR